MSLKTTRRVICLVVMLLSLSVWVFAASYEEDFSDPLPSTYLSVYNLSPIEDIRKWADIGTMPDESAYQVNPSCYDGGVIIKASGVRSVRVGFYSRVGIYATYSSNDQTYTLSSSYITGLTKRVMFDRSNQMLCVQEQGKTHYMVFNESKSLYQFIENANRTAKAEDLAYLGANIYVSQDNITYLPINAQVVRNDYGKMLDTDSSTVYCEVEAAVPVGYQYIKIEMTQPLFLATDPSFNSVAPTGERFRTCISRITLNGDSVRIISGQESSSSSSTSSSSTIPQEPRPDRPRKPTEDTTTSLPADGKAGGG